MQQRNSYHTNYIALYNAGLLEKNDYQDIPSSTRHNWKERDLTQLIGADYASALEDRKELYVAMNKYKKLEHMHKALHEVYLCLTTILDSLPSRQKVFRQNKKKILDTIAIVAPVLGLTHTLEYFGISTSQYHSWKNKITCPVSVFSNCMKRHPKQLTVKEVKTLKAYMSDVRFLHWSAASVWCKMVRDSALFISRATFYNYLNKLNLERRKRYNRRKKYKKGIRAKEPLQILHMDVMQFRPLDNTKVYIYIIQDNFSRSILGWKASLELSAEIACENLTEVYHRFLKDKEKSIQLITDGGSENEGSVRKFTADPKNVLKQLIAQKDILFSNSMVEAANKRIKYDFLFPQPVQNFEETCRVLEKGVSEFNAKPLVALNTLTPNEVLAGMLRKIGDYYSVQFEKARTKRIAENKGFNCRIKC